MLGGEGLGPLRSTPTEEHRVGAGGTMWGCGGACDLHHDASAPAGRGRRQAKAAARRGGPASGRLPLPPPGPEEDEEEEQRVRHVGQPVHGVEHDNHPEGGGMDGKAEVGAWSGGGGSSFGKWPKTTML